MPAFNCENAQICEHVNSNVMLRALPRAFVQ